MKVPTQILVAYAQNCHSSTESLHFLTGNLDITSRRSLVDRDLESAKYTFSVKWIKGHMARYCKIKGHKSATSSLGTIMKAFLPSTEGVEQWKTKNTDNVKSKRLHRVMIKCNHDKILDS